MRPLEIVTQVRPSVKQFGHPCFKVLMLLCNRLGTFISYVLRFNHCKHNKQEISHVKILESLGIMSEEKGS